MKKLSKTLAMVLNIAINTLSKKIDKLGGGPIKPLLDNVSGTLLKIVSIYSDDNEDNKAQMEQLGKEVIQENIIDYHQYTVDNLLVKLTDPDLKNGAEIILNNAKNIGLILTDENPDNNAQLRALLEDQDVILAETAKDILVSKLKQSENDTAQMIVELLEFLDLESIVDPE